MTDAVFSDALPADDPRLVVLRTRIAWLCHAMRVTAVAWFFWKLTILAWIASDPATQIGRVARKYEVDPATISHFSFWSGIGVFAFGAVLSGPLVYFVWRLTRAFLDGRIFTVELAVLLRNVGMAGFVATAAGMLATPLATALLSTAVFDKLPLYEWLGPDDLLYFFIAAFVFALGAILKTAAEIAEDHRQIV